MEKLNLTIKCLCIIYILQIIYEDNVIVSWLNLSEICLTSDYPEYLKNFKLSMNNFICKKKKTNIVKILQS